MQTHVHVFFFAFLILDFGSGDLKHHPRPIRIGDVLQFERLARGVDGTGRSESDAEKDEHNQKKRKRETRDFSEFCKKVFHDLFFL